MTCAVSYATSAWKVGIVGTVGFEQRVRDLVLDLPHIAAVVIPLLAARSALRVQLANLHKMLLDEVRVDPVCRPLMTAPGVGPVVALTYRACVDNPARFSRSKCEPKGDYEIGYCRPPKATQFQRGQSGNPRGPGKRPRSIGAAADKAL